MMNTNRIVFVATVLLALSLSASVGGEGWSTGSRLDAALRPLLEAESLQLEAKYLIRVDSGDESFSGHATVRYWQQGDFYRQVTTVDDNLEKIGLAGDTDYSWDGQEARTYLAGTRGVGTSSAAHPELPAALPNPLTLMTEFLVERPSQAQRLEPEIALERLDRLATRLDQSTEKATSDSALVETADGTDFRIEIDSEKRLDRIFKTLPDGPTAVIDFEQYEPSSTIEFPRKITVANVESLETAGQPQIEIVILVTEFAAGVSIPSEQFKLEIPTGHTVWDTESRTLYSDDGKLLRQD